MTMMLYLVSCDLILWSIGHHKLSRIAIFKEYSDGMIVMISIYPLIWIVG